MILTVFVLFRTHWTVSIDLDKLRFGKDVDVL